MADNGSSKVTCCCCIPIRAGVWTLAILGLIGSGWYILEAGIFLGSGVTADDIRAQNTTQEVKDNADAILAVARGSNVIKLGSGLINLALSILLILGLKDYRVGHLRTWVKVNIGFLIFGAVVLAVGLIAIMVLVGTAVGVAVGFGAFIFIALSFAWQGYYVWVVHRYADIMEAETSGGGGGPGGVAYAVEKA